MNQSLRCFLPIKGTDSELLCGINVALNAAQAHGKFHIPDSIPFPFYYTLSSHNENP
jgi:hypothetical protein